MTEFQRLVFDAVAKIPCGQVATYGDIACAIGYFGGARAVGNALHTNTDPIAVPCHRVVNSSGRLALFYAFGGIDAQAERLIAEGVDIQFDRVINFKQVRKQW